MTKNSFCFLLILVMLNFVQGQNKVSVKEYVLEGSSSGAIQNVEYKDVYGQTVQTNAVKFSPQQKDLVTYYELDEYGRPYRTHLPVPTTQNSGSYINPTSLLSTASAYYNTHYGEDQYIYSETEYEASPLNRPLKQSSPGEDWQMGGGHEIEFEYKLNAGTEVVNFSVTTSLTGDVYIPTLVKNGYYTANQLTKTIIKDENHSGNSKEHTIEEYKNRLGQVVMKRTYGKVGTGTSVEKHDTYYVYDNYGNLTFVLPPLISHTSGIVAIRNNLAELGYQYRYDIRNRLVEKKLPGKGWEYLVYDKQDRLVATKDALFPWLFTAYDKLGRVLYTGQVTGNYTRSQVQTHFTTLPLGADGSHNNERYSSSPFPSSGINVYYTKNFLQGLSYTLLTVQYYDSYPTALVTAENITIPTTVQGQAVINSNTTVDTKGLPTVSYVRILETTDWEKTFQFYDQKLRTIATHKKNHLGGFTRVEYQLDFRGKPVLDYTRQSRIHNSDLWEITQQYTYDHRERPLLHTNLVMTEPLETIASNEYDALGQLKRKWVGRSKANDKPLQKVDYQYNIRGWLTNINDTDDLEDEFPLEQMDMFAFKISYNTPIDVTGGISALYNGNISETYWRTGKDNVLRSYGYKYDALNRLKNGYYRRTGSVNPYEGTYNEFLTYDKNGNILTIDRNGGYDIQGGMEEMDELAFAYIANTNKLNKVTDATANAQGFNNGSSGTSVDYTYDENGNMLTDKNKGINNKIQYNHLNLPKYIHLPGGKITYKYNALGVKVEKYVDTEETQTDYLDGFQYINGELQFIPHAEGYINFAQIPELQEFRKFWYIYNYTDHLGNVRVSYAENPQNVGNIVILQENNYYPFGLQHGGYNKDVKEIDFEDYLNLTNEELQNINEDELITVIPVLGGKYKYKYQGQERQDELGLNWDSFKWRNYDYAIGRFFNVDPLAEKYSYQSPYNFSENRVVDAVELEGLEAFLIHGTWSDDTFMAGTDKARLANDFGNSTYYTKEWSGGNSIEARTIAAKEQFDFIVANRVTSEPITLIGHSHGGNVAIETANLLTDYYGEGAEINVLTINTPVRGDYQLDDENILHINVYSESDQVQINGGPWYTGGSADRTFDVATNVSYEDQISTFDSSGCGISGHCGTATENINVWEPEVVKEIERLEALPTGL